nr:aminoacyl-tRNA synthetase, class 1a, anticodon-binding [Tanacetum cinerariifolium]
MEIASQSTSQIPAASPCATTAVPPATSAIPPGASDAPIGASTILPGASNVFAPASAVPADTPNVPTGVSSKGKSPMVEEDIPVKARTFRQIEEDRMGEEAAKRMHEEELAQMERKRAKAQRKRQQDVLDSAMYYTESDWLTIRAQVEANASLSKTLLGDDVSEDNFPALMAELFKKKRQALAEQLFKESQIQAFSQTLKRPGRVLKEPSTKRPNSPEAPTPSMPEVLISPAVTSPPSSRTRRKSLGRKHMHKPKSPLPKLNLDAHDQTFLKVVVDEDSVDEVWSAVVGWEVLPTPLGEINALYRIDGTTKLFATLRQILHMVDRQDLMKLYGLVGYCVWQTQHPWEIRSWRLYTLSNVHVLETVSGEVLSMFTDVSYPLSVQLMERMFMHKLEIDLDFVGNDLTIAEQLIQFIKNQLVAAQASSV